MSTIDNGGAAFPSNEDKDACKFIHHEGMTLQQYAAINLKVPDSGTDWLDEMIVKSLRNDFAAKAMQAFISARATLNEADVDSYSYASSIGIGCPNIWLEGTKINFCQDVASEAYFMADAMLESRE